MEDVFKISKGISKENEIFDYANIPDYLKSSKNDYDYGKRKDNDLSR